VGVVVGVITGTPFEFELTKVVTEVLNVIPDLTGFVRVAEETALFVFFFVVGGIVGRMMGVDVDFVDCVGTAVVVGGCCGEGGG
jgi:hypothetical protein